MKRELLDNGTVIISLKKLKDFTARIVIASRFGSIHEPEKKEGLAHLLEHTILSANTKIYNFNEIAEKMDFLGAHQNGRTDYDSVRIFGYTPLINFEKFSDILTELSLEPQFNLRAFENEKKIILTELKGYLDNPSKYLKYNFLQALYKKHPIRTSIQDEIKAIKNIKLKDIFNAHKIYFAPHNLILGIFGNFKKRTYNKLKNNLECFNTGKLSNIKIPKEDMKPFRKKTVEKRRDIKQVYIQIGVKTATVDSEDIHALRIISTLLTSGDSSRLFKELRLKRGLVYSVHSYNLVGKEIGFFYIKTITEKQKGKETLKIIRRELKKLKMKKISERELKKAKNIIASLRKSQYDDPVEGALRFVKDEIVLGNVNKERENMKKLNKVSTKEVQNVAKKYFEKDNFATAIIRPSQRVIND